MAPRGCHMQRAAALLCGKRPPPSKRLLAGPHKGPYQPPHSPGIPSAPPPPAQQLELYRDTRESILLATQQPHVLRDMAPAARDRALRTEMRAERNLHPALQAPEGHYKVGCGRGRHRHRGAACAAVAGWACTSGAPT